LTGIKAAARLFILSTILTVGAAREARATREIEDLPTWALTSKGSACDFCSQRCSGR